VIRAIENNNLKLLKELVHDQKNIPSLTDAWSAESDHLEPLTMILERKDTKMLEILLKISDQAAESLEVRNQHLRSFYTHQRARVRPYLLSKVDTGHVSNLAYGTAVRTVEQTRGNRQGNQAFYFDELRSSVPEIEYTSFELKKLTPDFIKAYQLLTGNI